MQISIFSEHYLTKQTLYLFYIFQQEIIIQQVQLQHKKYSQKMEEKNQKESLTTLPKGYTYPDVSDMPFEIDYILAIPATETKPPKSGSRPYVLTFKNEDTTFATLMAKYISATKYSIPQSKYYYFITASSYKIDPSSNVKDLRKTLQRDKLNGVVLLVQSSNEQYDGDQYSNECCVIDFMDHQKPKEDDLAKFYLRIQLQLFGCEKSEILYINCKLSYSGEDVVKQLSKQISTQFGLNNFNWSSIAEIYIVDPKDANNQIKFYQFQPLFNQKIYSGTTLFVKFANPQKQDLKRINQKKYNSWIVIYKENQTEPVRLKYDEIANLTFIDLYENVLRIKTSEKKKEAVYCLKIMDKIIKPQERLNSAEKYFINTDPTKTLNVVGKVVNEKMIFWKIIPNLTAAKNSEFKLDEIVIPPTQQTQRKNCEAVIKERAQSSTKQYFKNTANVEPIVIYTSELSYLDPLTNEQLVIYQALNKYLRETRILSLDETIYSKEWKLRYASTLLKHLQMTTPFKGLTWRGISYDPNITQKDKGHIFTFKQFTSTSIMKNTAVGFAQNGYQQPYHLLAFTLKSGRSVIEYSIYQEGEMIVQPFTEFECIDVKQEKINGSMFNVYYLEERQTSKELPGIKANFVIWIDDKPEEAMSIYKNMKIPTETTVYNMLKSTAELDKWLEEHKQMFLDDSANLIFVTNMTRMEQANLNGLAGIEGANLIRKYSKTVPIYFYIFNLQGTYDKLKASDLSLDFVKVSNQTAEIEAYLKSKI